MKSILTHTAAVTVAFATGFVAGLLLAPRSGENTRKKLAEDARERLQAAEKQVESIEKQLSELNEKVNERRKELTGKLRKAAQETIELHIPDLSSGEEEWSEGGEEDVVRDLRHMKRK